MSTHHVRAALLEAQEALAHLLSDEVMLERINAAGSLAGAFIPAETAGASAMRCTLPKR